MDNGKNIMIRPYAPGDRDAVRRISYQTALLGKPLDFIEDEEVVADFLTLYFTDYEPQSAFVAVRHNDIAGYLIGTKDVRRMRRCMALCIIPRILGKSFKRGVFYKRSTWRFLFHAMMSFIKGEFCVSNYVRRYPASFHINIVKDFRGGSVGSRLVHHYLDFLRKNGITGVYAGTMSRRAQIFFIKNGFQVLYQSKRSHLHYRLGQDVAYYLLGKNIIKDTGAEIV